MRFSQLSECPQSGQWSSVCSTTSSACAGLFRPPPGWPGFLPSFLPRLSLCLEGLNSGLFPPEPDGVFPSVHCLTKASNSVMRALSFWFSAKVLSRLGIFNSALNCLGKLEKYLFLIYPSIDIFVPQFINLDQRTL